MGILLAVIGVIAAFWQTWRSFHVRGEERNKPITVALGFVIVICAALTAQRQSQNSDTIKQLLTTERQNAADLKEERTGRRDFEKAFWEFTKSLDPNKFTVRQYVNYRQAVKASTAESATGALPPVPKISPSPAAIEAMKRNFDNWEMQIAHMGYSMPDRRQDARRRIVGETYYQSNEKLTELQKQKNRDEYLLELDRLDEADATQYKRLEPDLRSVLSDAFTMLDFSDSRKVSEFAKFNDLSERATSSTHRSENASPHEKDYIAIARYLHSIAVQL